MNGTLRLRAMELDDVELIYQVENDASMWHLGNSNVPYSRELLRTFVLNSTGDIYADKQTRLMIEDKEGQVLGMVDLTDFSPKHQRAEVGIVVLPPFRKQGCATEAVRLIDKYAKEVLAMNQLYAYIETTNDACRHAFQSNGYQVVASLHQWIRVGDAFRDVVMVQKFF